MERAPTHTAVKGILGLAVGLLIIGIYSTPLLTRLEYISLDLLFKLRGPLPVSEKIVMIDIDDHSLDEIGRWPWSRDYHATMITILNKLGAKVIILDILFTEAEKGINDQVLAAAIQKAGNVYLPTGTVRDQHGRVHRLLEPLPILKKGIKGTGHIEARPDKDGVVRRIPLFVDRPDGQKLPHMILDMFAKEGGMSIDRLSTPANGSWILPLKEKTLHIPIDQDRKMLINWAGRWAHTFRHYRFTDVIINYNNYLTGKPTSIELEKIKGAYCIVGVPATTLSDNKPSPLEPEYPGPYINAMILNSLLMNDFIYPVSSNINRLTILILAVLVSLLTSRLHPWRSVFGLIGVVILFFLTNVLNFSLRSHAGTIAHPIVALVISYIAASVFDHLKLMKERNRLSGLAQRDGLTGLYNVATFKVLLEQNLRKMKTGEMKFLSLIMCDIDHFKMINDSYGHPIGDAVLKRVATVLRSHSRTMDVAARYGGEEFILMVPGCDIDQGWEIAEKLRGVIAGQQFREVPGDLKVTMSFGVASYLGEEDLDSLIRRADQALYGAKDHGRNKVQKAAA